MKIINISGLLKQPVKDVALLDLQWSTIETRIFAISFSIGVVVLIYLLRLDWKRYGLFSLIAALMGGILCTLFVSMGLYKFPYLPIPNKLGIPVAIMSLVFPSIIALSVRYSPTDWTYKIPYYWVIVHIFVFLELLTQEKTNLIKYTLAWDLWDTYSAWWIYFLVLEWIGGKIITSNLRKPIDTQAFRYGNWAWILLHAILIFTIFLGGLYTGTLLAKT